MNEGEEGGFGLEQQGREINVTLYKREKKGQLRRGEKKIENDMVAPDKSLSIML